MGNREAAAAAAASRELEALRNALRDKENVIQRLVTFSNLYIEFKLTFITITFIFCTQFRISIC